MIIGIGTDIVDIRRIQKLLDRHQEHFIDKIFTNAEQKKANTRKNPISAYAKIFAAKEAFIKALGGSYNMQWHDMEISNNSLGKPLFNISGNGLLVLEKQCSGQQHSIHLSLSDEPPYAIAYVIIETHT
ncbi:MAG: holo-[acyl-carrier-protein] synthase [Alphaproteobacteria bacterium CG_4_10_14_0_8_um_filter_37_21]|nr:MAG: holo-[acyl-carrier-protein] synthase [Alphaproteobacteria bacterium CG_4_10_14_0_8_um_filter_37_21]